MARYQNRKYNGGKPIARKASSEKEAYAKLEQIKEELFGGQLADGTTDATVKEYMTRWVNTAKRGVIKDQSVDRIESTLETHIFPTFGSFLMNTLTSNEIQNHLQNLFENGKSYSTVKKVYDAFNDCCKTAIELGHLKRNPMNGVVMREQAKINRRKKKDQVPFYSPKEEEKLVNAALYVHATGRPKYRLGWVIPFVLNTGIRVGELAALQWDLHVDFKNRCISVENTQIRIKNRNPDADVKYIIKDQLETKSEAGQRIIELNDAALEALTHLYAITGKGKYVVSTPDLKPLHIIHLDRLMGKVCKAAGFSKERTFGMHVLRHTFASSLFAEGVDVKVVSELLGHYDTKITYDTYIHLIDSQKKKAIHVINRKRAAS